MFTFHASVQRAGGIFSQLISGSLGESLSIINKQKSRLQKLANSERSRAIKLLLGWERELIELVSEKLDDLVAAKIFSEMDSPPKHVEPSIIQLVCKPSSQTASVAVGRWQYLSLKGNDIWIACRKEPNQ